MVICISRRSRAQHSRSRAWVEGHADAVTEPRRRHIPGRHFDALLLERHPLEDFADDLAVLDPGGRTLIDVIERATPFVVMPGPPPYARLRASSTRYGAETRVSMR